MTKGIRLALVLLAATAAVQEAPSAQTAAPAKFNIEPLPSPAGSADVTAAQITVQGDRLILSWLEVHGPHAVLKYSERIATGWSPAQTVVSGEQVLANPADVPSVHALPDGRLAALWLQKNGDDPEAYDLNLSTSSDKGRTWTVAAPRPHRDQTKTQHGFASLFNMPGGGFGVVWLDGRETVSKDGAMTLRSTLYGGEAKAGDSLVAPRVCDCCPTAAVTTADGVVVAFRNRTADEIRDLYVTRFDGQSWSAPTAVHNDGWKINGCPVNGPSLSARGRDVAIAWFTAAGGPGRSWLAFSQDAGRTFGAPVRVDDDAALGRVQVALTKDGSAAVSWIEFGKGVSELRARRVTRNGSRSPAVRLAIGVGSQFPRMAAARDELVFAWMENTRGITQLRTARAKL